MQVRPATRADLPAIAAIQIASWRNAYRNLLPDDYLGQPVADDLNGKWLAMIVPETDVLLVAETEGGVQGFIYVQGDRRPAYIDNLHVQPDAKRGGIGAALMRAAFTELRTRGHDAACLTVITDNAPAVAFYRKMGGQFGPQQDERLYGAPVRTYPVSWPDLSALI